MEFIWKENLPDLHVHIPREKKEEWFTWAMKLKEKTSYWCSALARVDPTTRLVRQFAPLGSDTAGVNVVRAAYNMAAQRLRRGWKDPETHFSSEKQRARSLGKVVEVLENIEGTEVTIWASGKVHFLWKKPDSNIVSFAINGSRHLVPRSQDDKRFIRFNQDGIVIVGPNGDLILRRDQTEAASVTWTTKELALLPQKDDLKACGEHHVPQGHWRIEGEDEDFDDAIFALPVNYFQPKGSPPLCQKQKSTGYAKPPKPGDGTWIMNEFLNQTLHDTEGGRLFNGHLADFPERDAEHMRRLLGDFIRRPRFRHYPWKTEWLAWIDASTSSATSNIRENIKFCRDVSNKSASKSSGRYTPDGKPINLPGTWWYIGPRKQGW